MEKNILIKGFLEILTILFVILTISIFVDFFTLTTNIKINKSSVEVALFIYIFIVFVTFLQKAIQTGITIIKEIPEENELEEENYKTQIINAVTFMLFYIFTKITYLTIM
jgi:hypothetical protein